jgi:NADPH:quinone reductase-like Zn-dependent oxidoreductase
VQGAAGAVGQALLVLGKMAGVELWGTARGEHARVVRELGGNPIDYQREDFTRVLPSGFDIVFDRVGQDSYRRSYAALKPGGLLVAYGYSASVQPQRRLPSLLTSLARVYLWRGLLRLLPGGKRTYVYSINLMRAQHPSWFKEDLERLFGLLAARTIRPRIAEWISFDQIIEAHRRVEAGGLDGKLVLCPDFSPPLPPENLITLPHFSLSSAMSLAKAAGAPESTVPHRSANRACSLRSRRPALIP